MAEQLNIFNNEARSQPKRCPCCGQLMRTWKKRIISTAVASLCRLVYLYEGQALHHDKFTVLAKDRNFSQLKLWGLIQAENNNDHQKRSSGRWHPTKKALDFVKGEILIHQYIVTKNNKLISQDPPLIDIETALNNKFDYSKLLSDNWSN